MILKIIICKEDDMMEIFQITNYYIENTYLEADIDGAGRENREIILSEGKYLDDREIWEEITILTDQGFELLKIKNEELD